MKLSYLLNVARCIDRRYYGILKDFIRSNKYNSFDAVKSDILKLLWLLGYFDLLKQKKYLFDSIPYLNCSYFIKIGNEIAIDIRAFRCKTNYEKYKLDLILPSICGVLGFRYNSNYYYSQRDIISLIASDIPQLIELIKSISDDKSLKYYTYLILDTRTNLVKIGKSKNVKARESTLQSEYPLLKVIAASELNCEKYLHSRFNYLRIRGEWFKLSKKQISQIIKEYDFIKY